MTLYILYNADLHTPRSLILQESKHLLRRKVKKKEPFIAARTRAANHFLKVRMTVVGRIRVAIERASPLGGGNCSLAFWIPPSYPLSSLLSVRPASSVRIELYPPKFPEILMKQNIYCRNGYRKLLSEVIIKV